MGATFLGAIFLAATFLGAGGFPGAVFVFGFVVLGLRPGGVVVASGRFFIPRSPAGASRLADAVRW